MKNRRQTLTTRLMSLSKLYLLPPLLFTLSSTGYPGYLLKFQKFKQNKIVINFGERSARPTWNSHHFPIARFLLLRETFLKATVATRRYGRVSDFHPTKLITI